MARYYDSKNGRFINLDKFVSTGNALLGNNMFSYCENNPVNKIDRTGELSFSILAITVVFSNISKTKK